MARVQNPLIGHSSGSVGGSTFSTWKGINVLKSKAITVANPKTDKQLMQRTALTKVVAIYRIILAAVALGFRELAIKMSAYNAFESYNLKNAFDFSSPPDATFDSTLLVVSKGTIAPQAIDTIVSDQSLGTVVIDWTAAVLSPGQSNTDMMNVVIWNGTIDKWVVALTGDNRASSGTSIAIPAAWHAGHVLSIYTFFTNPASKKSDTSIYTNSVMIA